MHLDVQLQHHQSQPIKLNRENNRRKERKKERMRERRKEKIYTISLKVSIELVDG
jgi:hypothetical protein